MFWNSRFIFPLFNTGWMEHRRPFSNAQSSRHNSKTSNNILAKPRINSWNDNWSFQIDRRRPHAADVGRHFRCRWPSRWRRGRISDKDISRSKGGRTSCLLVLYREHADQSGVPSARPHIPNVENVRHARSVSCRMWYWRIEVIFRWKSSSTWTVIFRRPISASENLKRAFHMIKYVSLSVKILPGW